MPTLPRILIALDVPSDEADFQSALDGDFRLEFLWDPGLLPSALERFDPHVMILNFREGDGSALAIAHLLRCGRSESAIGLMALDSAPSTARREEASRAGIDLVLPHFNKSSRLHAAIEALLTLNAARRAVQALDASYRGSLDIASGSQPSDRPALALVRQLRTEFRRAQRYQKNLVLLLIRIDPFQVDPDGDLYWESWLPRIGETIARSTRYDVDRSGPSRHSEFFVILPETDICGAITVAERVRNRINGLQDNETGRRLTTSVGVVHYNGDRGNFETAEEFLHTACVAVRSAEEHGGDQYWALDTSTEDLMESRSA